LQKFNTAGGAGNFLHKHTSRARELFTAARGNWTHRHSRKENQTGRIWAALGGRRWALGRRWRASGQKSEDRDRRSEVGGNIEKLWSRSSFRPWMRNYGATGRL